MRSFNSISKCLYDILTVFVTTCLDRCVVFMRALWPQRTGMSQRHTMCMSLRHTIMRAVASIRRVGGAMLAIALVTVSCQVTVSTPTPSDTTEPTFVDGPRVDASTDTGATVALKANEDATLHWVLYQEGDATPDSAAILIGHATASGGIQRDVVDITTDTREIVLTGLTSGTSYRFYAVLKDTAENIGALARVTVTTVTFGHPDLTVAVTTTTATSVVAGESVPLSATVTNTGTAAAVPTTLQWYSSTDDTIDTSDTALGSQVSVAALAAGDQCQRTDYQRATAPATPGPIYYGACVVALPTEANSTNNCSSGVKITVTEAPTSDLTVAVSANPTSTTVGESVSLSATVTNSGTANAAETTLQWYRSSDAAIDVGDTALGSAVAVAALTAGTSASALTTSVQAPATTGTVYYGACVTAIAGEADAANNCSSVAITVTAAPKSDLTVSVSATDTSVVAGGSVPLSATVTNTGTAAAVPTTLQWYSSTDATITATDTPVGSAVAVTALAAAADTGPLNTTATAPATTGTVYYGACVVAVTNEANSNNNCSSSVEIAITEALKPDLTVVVTANSSSASTDGDVPLSATVTNSGTAAAVATDLQWYSSADATIGSTDTPVGSAVAVAALAAGADSVPLDTTATAPSTPSTIYYGACVTAIDGEANTGNNCSSSVKIAVTAAPQADLTVVVTATDNSVVAGGNASIHAIVTNSGNAASTPTTLQWYSSSDAAIDVNDTPLGSLVNVAALAVGSKSGQLNTTATAPATPGPIYYGACVTAISGEADAANNCSSVQITVTEAPKADLTVVVTATPSSTTVSQNVALSATVTNSGGADAAATKLQWYSSSDAAIDVGDTSLGSLVDVAALTAGTSASALTTSVNAPATTGTIYYGACVTAIAGEADAANNCHSVEITVTAAPKPDLTVAAPTASSATVSRGATFTLSTTVTNSGAGAAGATDLQWYRSLDTTIGTDDTTLGSAVDVAALAAAAVTAALSSGDLTAPNTPGMYHYGACVAAVNDEANTNNNCSASVTVTVSTIYTCSNGAAKSGTPGGTADVGACQSCSGGFKLSGTPGDVATTCVETVYTCSNGTPTTGSKPAGNSDVGACQSCSDGFKLSGAPGVGTTCVDTDYTCNNGTAKDGKPTGTADVEGCSSCETGYKLGGTGGDDCLATVYTCNNGVPTTGSPAGNSDVAQCQSCDSTYKLVNNACTTRTVYTCSNGAPASGNPDGNDDVARCQSCDTTYKLVNNACTPTVYTCSNGAPTTGSPAGNSDVAQCSSCDSTYKLVNNACTPTVYTCSNGAPTAGSPAGTSDVASCKSCDTTYKLVNNACTPTVYTCSNGVVKTGNPAGTADVEGCSSCDSGYKLGGDGGDDCVVTVYTCNNGAAKPGTPGGTADVVACQSCNNGFKLTGNAGADNTACVDTVYTCDNGTPTSGKPSGNVDVVECASCAYGYTLNTISKMCEANFVLHSNGVTILCPNAGLDTTGDVGGTTYTKRAVGKITTTNAATTCTSGITTMTDATLPFDSSTFNGDISHWDTSSVTNMWRLFYQTSKFNQDIGDWDVSKVMNMQGVFDEATAFNQDIGDWNVSKVTKMHNMFNNALAFNQDIGDWTVSSVERMDGMFDGATAFNQDIGDWDVSKVTDMSYMFHDSTAFNQDIGDWNVGNVTKIFSMFRDATAFNQDIGGWNVSNVTDMSGMFNGATVFNQDLSGWCVSNIASASGGFATGAASGFTTARQPQWGTCPQP